MIRGTSLRALLANEAVGTGHWKRGYHPKQETTKGAYKEWLRPCLQLDVPSRLKTLDDLATKLSKLHFDVMIEQIYSVTRIRSERFEIEWQPEYGTLFIAVFRNVEYAMGIDC